MEIDAISVMLNDMQSDKSGFAVSELWIQSWLRFVKSDHQFTVPPGNIDNNGLLDKDGLPMLSIKKRYSKVTAKAWNFFLSIYGGGTFDPVVQVVLCVCIRIANSLFLFLFFISLLPVFLSGPVVAVPGSDCFD